MPSEVRRIQVTGFQKGIRIATIAGNPFYLHVSWFVNEASTAAGRQTQLEEIFADVRVGDVMVADCRTILADATLDRVVRDHFTRHGHGGYPVVRDGEMTRVSSLADATRVSRERRPEVTAESAMTPVTEETVVDIEGDILTALRQMAALGSGRLLVRDAGRCVGMVTHSDILRRWQVARALGEG